MNLTTSKYLLPLFLSTMLLQGCTSIGPKMLPNNRHSYNTALYESTNNQLLLNIVRIRYGGGIYFLDISNISAQTIAEANLAVPYLHSHAYDKQPEKDLLRTVTNTFTINPSVSYHDKPTISYTPLQGSKVTSQFLAPIPLQDIYLLVRSGWSANTVLSMTVQKIGALNNISSYSTPTKRCAAPTSRFAQFTELLQQLKKTNDISIGLEKYTNKQLSKEVDLMAIGKNPETRDSIVVSFSKTPAGLRGQRAAAKLLHLPGPYQKIYLVPTDSNVLKGNAVAIETRSIESTLYYLSKSVKIRENDSRKHLAETDYCSNGKVFDWSQTVKKVMRINNSDARPSNTFASVYYRNQWFYIADTDVQSKRALDLLNVIFALRAGERRGAAPALTLSI